MDMREVFEVTGLVLLLGGIAWLFRWAGLDIVAAVASIEVGLLLITAANVSGKR